MGGTFGVAVLGEPCRFVWLEPPVGQPLPNMFTRDMPDATPQSFIITKCLSRDSPLLFSPNDP